MKRFILKEGGVFMEKRKLVLTIIGVVILAMVIMVYIYFSKPGSGALYY